MICLTDGFLLSVLRYLFVNRMFGERDPTVELELLSFRRRFFS